MAERRTLAVIGRVGGPLIDRAVADALPTADGPTQAASVELLLDRGATDGLVGLIRHYHQLAEPARQRVLATAGTLGGACQRVGGSADRQARLNMVEIVEAGSLARLAYLLTGQLRDDDGPLSKAAAAALLRLTRRYLIEPIGESSEAGPADRETIAALRKAVGEACGRFERHRRRDVLLAAVCFAPDLGPTIEKHAVEPEGVATKALSGLISNGEDVLVRRQLLALACWEGLGPAVTLALREGEAGSALACVLERGHFLVAPQVRRAVRCASRGGRLAPGWSQAAEWPDGVRRWLWRWLDAAGSDVTAGTALAGGIAADGRRIDRLRAARWLSRQDDAQAAEVLATLCFDPEAAVARVALLRLIAGQWSGLNGLMLRLVASEHASVRRIVERHIAPIGFERLWQNWGRLSEEDQVKAGRALVRIDPGFGRKLWQKLRAGEAGSRLQAVMMVRQLEQVSYYEAELRSLTRDADERVASAAVKALGESRGSGNSEAAVAAALVHRDDRVRANAVEALTQLDRVGAYSGQLLALSEEAGNRSRATAIKALLEAPMSEAVPKLRRMLCDGDERHRSSALWVVEKLGLGGVLKEVAARAKVDEVGRVRQRALRVLRSIANDRVGGTQAGKANVAGSVGSVPGQGGDTSEHAPASVAEERA